MGSSASMGSVVTPSSGGGGGAPSPTVVQNNGFIALGPLGGKFYLVKELDGSFRQLRADTLIKVSTETSVITAVASSPPGTKTSRTYSVVAARGITSGGLARLRLAVVEGVAGGSYRVNLVVKKNGVTVASTIGPTRVRALTTFVWLLSTAFPQTSFAAGDTFGVSWEHEIVTSIGAATGDTVRTDPSVAGNEAILEVDA